MAKAVLAVIDLGTNTFKYVVAIVEPQTSSSATQPPHPSQAEQKSVEPQTSPSALPRIDILADEALSGRLGRELAKTGSIGPEATSEALSVIRDIQVRIGTWKPVNTLCVGAMTLRTAQDAPEFIQALYQATGLRARVLSGDEEARLAWKAATMRLPVLADQAVLDIGGGSFELILGSDQPAFSHSFPLGALTLKDQCICHDPPLETELQEARELVKTQLHQQSVPEKASALIAIGGTAVNLAAIQRSLDSNPDLEGSVISVTELERMLKLFSGMTLAQRRNIPGLTPSRADIIIPGTLILSEVLDHLGLSSFRVSTRGIRHALLTEL